MDVNVFVRTSYTFPYRITQQLSLVLCFATSAASIVFDIASHCCLSQTASTAVRSAFRSCRTSCKVYQLFLLAVDYSVRKIAEKIAAIDRARWINSRWDDIGWFEPSSVITTPHCRRRRGQSQEKLIKHLG